MTLRSKVNPLLRTLLASIFVSSSLLASIPMLEKNGKNHTIRVLEKAPKEGDSVGSYTMYVYDKYGEFVVGKVAPRDGEVQKVWFIEKEEGFWLFIWSVSTGSGSYGSLDAYLFKEKNLSKIPIATPKKELLDGYMGHDIFNVDGKNIYRSFPIYKSSDANSDRPSKTRCLVYSLSSKLWIDGKGCTPTSLE